MNNTKNIMNERLEDLKDKFEITDRLIISFKLCEILTVEDFLNAIQRNKIKNVYGLGIKKFNRICQKLESLGIVIPDVIQSNQINFLIDDIDGIENISYYTKNYIIFKYNLKEIDIFELENIMNEYCLNFKNNDIIDAGLDRCTAYILYTNDIYTISQLQKAYSNGDILTIRRIGNKRLNEIKQLLYS